MLCINGIKIVSSKCEYYEVTRKMLLYNINYFLEIITNDTITNIKKFESFL